MPAGPGGNVAVDGCFVDPVGRTQPGHNVQSPCRSTRTQAQEHSPHPTRTEMSRQAYDGERPEQVPSVTTPASDGHDPIHDRDIGFRVAIAYSHPDITHARATSCPICTCAHVGCGWEGELCPVDLFGFRFSSSFDRARSVSWFLGCRGESSIGCP
jgi:hypothetical protein